MSEQRQLIEFLRRRYASAILRDDVRTAGRMRAQLDGVMNCGDARRVARTERAVTQQGEPFLSGPGQQRMAPWPAGSRLDSAPEVGDTT